MEINRTFYRLPTQRAFDEWKRAAPEGFLYSLKGSRAVTHFKRLLPGAKSLNLLLGRSQGLGEHREPVLWQLPGTFKRDPPRLQNFLRTLDGHIRHAIEFRDPSWIDEEVFEILRRRGVANVALSSEKMPRCLEVTADFVLRPVPRVRRRSGSRLHRPRFAALGKISAGLRPPRSDRVCLLQQRYEHSRAF